MWLTRLLSSVGLAAILASAGAGPAAAQDPDPYPDANFPISVGVVGPAAEGQPVTLRLSGSTTSDGSSIPGSYNSELVIFNAGFIPACPRAFEQARGLFIDNPSQGTILSSGSQNLGSSGPFSVDARYTPGGSGGVLACAYIRYVIDDVNFAQTTFTVAPAAGTPSPPGTPAPTPAPAPAPPAPAITTAPKSLRGATLRRGTTVRVTSAAGARVSARLRIGSRTLASRTQTAPARGITALRLRATAATIRRALGSARSRVATLRVSVTPAGGGTAVTLTRRITFTR